MLTEKHKAPLYSPKQANKILGKDNNRVIVSWEETRIRHKYLLMRTIMIQLNNCWRYIYTHTLHSATALMRILLDITMLQIFRRQMQIGIQVQKLAQSLCGFPRLSQLVTETALERI